MSATGADNGLKVLNDNVNNTVKGSPYRKRLAKKQLDQIEVTQKLLSDFELKSPRKRVNENQIESPSKRAKDPHDDDNSSKNSSITDSPRTTRVSKFSLAKSTLSSTPKAKHKPNFQNLCDKTDEKVERNLSKSWIDIIDELEEQSKEIKEYTVKVCEKYKIDEEKLLKNIETDTEVLRKRQKQINYGKLTDEYKKYAATVQRKKRDKCDPRTPNKFRKCSRRQFDGSIKKWRKLLHIWADNPENLKNANFDDDEDEDDCTENTAEFDTKFTLDDFTITTTNSSSEENISEH